MFNSILSTFFSLKCLSSDVILPIFKKRDMDDSNNCRAIVLFTNIIYQLLSWFLNNAIISDAQFGSSQDEQQLTQYLF